MSDKNMNDILIKQTVQIVATGGGEKLEKWGEYYLLRPDPQAIWEPSFNLSEFRMLHGKYTRSKDGGGKWDFFKTLKDEWTIEFPIFNKKTSAEKHSPLQGEYPRSGGGVLGNNSQGERPINSLKFIISPTNFKHTGLFPEQCTNWEKSINLIKERTSRGQDVKVLNLFGYTGGATVAAAVAGIGTMGKVHVTHVDASKGMTEVCKRNVELNAVPSDRVRYIVEDCAKFVARELRRGNHYDVIIMDPPSFGRGAGGEVWKIEQHLDNLVSMSVQLLSGNPVYMLINSYTTGLQATVMKNLIMTNLKKHKRDGILKKLESYDLSIATMEDIDLPAGNSAIGIF